MKTILLFTIALLNITAINAQFVPEWVQTYNSQPQSNMTFSQSVVDAGSNQYMTGTIQNSGSNEVHIITLKYNSEGVFQWSKIYVVPGTGSMWDSPCSITLDGQGNIYVFGTIILQDTSTSFRAIKYNSLGNEIWTFAYNLIPQYRGNLTDCITDNTGNSYMAGRVYKPLLDKDTILILKINQYGSLLWTSRILSDYPDPYFFTQTIINFDNTNNVILTAYKREQFNFNILTQKYDNSGNLMWSKIYDDNGLSDIPFDTKSDNSGNVYITGVGGSQIYNDSGATILLKYNSSGSQQWVSTIRTTSNIPEYGYRLALDNSGSVFVLTRTSKDYSTTGHDIILKKYSESGGILWQKIFGSNNTYEIGYSVMVDNFGDPLTTGTYNNYGHTKLLLLKYSKTNGNIIQEYSYNQNDTSKDYGVKIIPGTSGNIYISGISDNSLLNMKLGISSSHSESHTNHVSKPINDLQSTYDTINFTTDMLPPFAYITDVNVSLDTIMHSAISDLEISLIHGYSSVSLTYRRGGFSDNYIGTKFDDTATVNICNSAAVPYTGYYAPCEPLSEINSQQLQGPWILKIYDRRSPDTGVLKSWSLNITYQTLIGLTQVSSQVPKTYLLSQNYPNPFNPMTKIKFNIPKSSLVKIVIFDLLGREIETIVDQQLKPGEYETEFNGSMLSSGVYFYRLYAGDFAESKKMVLVK